MSEQQQQNPQEAMKAAAVADEQNATIQALQARAVALNVEVRIRDARIVELEAELAAHAGSTPEPGT